MAEWKWDETRKAWRKELWISGRRTKLTCRGSKADALAYEARKRIELGATGVVPQRNAPAFESFCAEVYKPHAQASLRASTWNVRRYQLEPLIAHFRSTKLTRIDPAQIEAYKLARVREVDKVTVNSELNVLSAVLSYARHLRVPCASPKIKRFPTMKKKGLVKTYTREEVDFILAGAAAVSDSFAALVHFLAETGCRRSEAINLPWSRVDRERAMARIWSDVDDDEAYEVKSRDREVTLSEGLLVVLEAQRARVGDSTWVFPVMTNRASRGERRATKGERLASWPKHTWARALDKATELRRAPAVKAARRRGLSADEALEEAKRLVPELTGGPHRLRHTFASMFLAAMPDLFALGRVLGHSHSRVTELYAHLLPDHLASTRGVVTFKSPPKTPPKRLGGVRRDRNISQ